MLTTILAFIQAAPAAPAFPSPLTEYGVPTGILGLVLYVWREGRKDREIERLAREVERQAQEERYASLAEDFRKIVQENTASNVALRESNTAANAALRELVMSLVGRASSGAN